MLFRSAWAQPMFFRATGEAIRSFQSAANDPKHEIGMYPEDYSLFELGQFDPSSGVVELLPAPIHLATAVNLVSEAVKSQLGLFPKEAGQ